MSTQNFMSYGDAETIFTDVQAKKFSTGNVSTIQSTLTASKAYNQNDPFIYNGQLYKADSAIAQGDTITIGTNASATTIEELINLHSSSGSGGHTILNSSGTAQTQRDDLQFVGATISDDSTNGRTVVTVDVSEKANENTIAELYSSSTTYAVGNYFIYDGITYKVKVACAGVTPPNSTYYDIINVTGEISALNTDLNSVRNIANIAYGYSFIGFFPSALDTATNRYKTNLLSLPLSYWSCNHSISGGNGNPIVVSNSSTGGLDCRIRMPYFLPVGTKVTMHIKNSTISYGVNFNFYACGKYKLISERSTEERTETITADTQVTGSIVLAGYLNRTGSVTILECYITYP